MRCRAHYCAWKYAPFTHANVSLAALFCGYQTKLPTHQPTDPTLHALIRFFFCVSAVFLFLLIVCCCCWRWRCHRCYMVGWLRSLKYMNEIFLVCLWNVILNFSMAACSKLNYTHTRAHNQKHTSKHIIFRNAYVFIDSTAFTYQSCMLGIFGVNFKLNVLNATCVFNAFIPFFF